MPEQRRYYVNDTGTGNTLDLSHPRVIQMVTDSLRYWVQEMHVDGFRFDLGTILARETNGFDNRSGFLKVCSQDPVLTAVKLIAEPWDCGPGGYQVGEFPPGWSPLNRRPAARSSAFIKPKRNGSQLIPPPPWPSSESCSTSSPTTTTPCTTRAPTSGYRQSHPYPGLQRSTQGHPDRLL